MYKNFRPIKIFYCCFTLGTSMNDVHEWRPWKIQYFWQSIHSLSAYFLYLQHGVSSMTWTYIHPLLWTSFMDVPFEEITSSITSKNAVRLYTRKYQQEAKKKTQILMSYDDTLKTFPEYHRRCRRVYMNQQFFLKI